MILSNLTYFIASFWKDNKNKLQEKSNYRNTSISVQE